MRIVYTETFKKDFVNLPKEIQKIAEKKIKIFGDNSHHPSLRIKKMEGVKNIWEGRITDSYRFTFTMDNDLCILRRIGTHDILKKEK